MDSKEIRRWVNDSDSSVQGFSIHNQKVSVFKSKVRKRSSFQLRAEQIESDLQALVSHVELPNVDFFASLRDGECVSFASCKPIFLQAKQINNVCREGIFMPPRSANGFVSEAGLFSKAISRQYRTGSVLREQDNMNVPFRNKVNKAFFRGTMTGANHTPQNWRLMQRSRVVQVSLQFPGLLDARFTKVHGGSQRSEVESEMRAAGFLGPRVSQDDQWRYKLIVALDGNSVPDELMSQLASNSVVLKPESDHAEYWYAELVPWEHYIPFKKDASDLAQVIEMSLKNQTLLQHIARESASFVSSRLNPSRIMCYWGLLLRQYAVHLYTPSVPPVTSSVDTAVSWFTSMPPAGSPAPRKNTQTASSTQTAQMGNDPTSKASNKGVCVFALVCWCVRASHVCVCQMPI